MGKILIGIVAIFLVIGVFASSFTAGIKTWRTDDTTQSESVTTGVGVTTANVTLDSELYQAATAEVSSITSNITGEYPVASAYAEMTQVLLVSALNPSATRTLTINYYAETESEVMHILGPFLAVLIFGGLVGAIIWGMFGRR